MKTWVVADVHGDCDKLKLAYQNTPTSTGDKIVFLGDYVDRGPDSYDVVEFILGLKKYYDVVTLKGNHDDVFIQNLKDGVWDFYNQGQKKTLQSYVKNCAPSMKVNELCEFRWSDLPDTHKDFYSNLLSYHQDELGNLFVHGGINRHLQLHEQNDDLFLWDRDLLNSARSFHYSTAGKEGYTFKIKTNNVKKIFVGHTPVQYFMKSSPQTYGPVTVLDLGSGKYDEGKVCFLDTFTGDYFTN